MKRMAAALAALLAAIAPAAALACPQCAGRSDGNIARTLVLGAFVLFPFAVAAAVIRVVRSGERDEHRPSRAAGGGAPRSLRGGGGAQRGLRDSLIERPLPPSPRPG